MSISLITYSGQNVLPEYDAQLYHSMIPMDGIVSGCAITNNTTSIHIDAGAGILAGRYFTVDEETKALTLPASGTVDCALYIHMDLNDADTPIQIISGPVPTYQYDRANGIYDLRLAFYTVSPSGITAYRDTVPVVRNKLFLERNMSYSENETVFLLNNYPGLMCVCDSAGTTAAIEPTVLKGSTPSLMQFGFTDGTASFQAVALYKLALYPWPN